MFGVPFGFFAPQGITSPLQLPGCQLWLRSDLGITTVTGNVSAWANQGTRGATMDAAQSTGANRPIYTASGGQNNLPYLTFDGSRLMTIGALDSGISPLTIMMVLKCRSLPGTGFSVYSIGGPGTSEALLDFNTYKNVSYADGWPGGVTAMVGYDFSLGTSAVHYMLHTYDGVDTSTPGSYAGTQDSVTKSMVASGAYAISSTGALGARIGGTFASDIDLYELIILGALTGPQQALLNAYVKARYAL